LLTYDCKSCMNEYYHWIWLDPTIDISWVDWAYKASTCGIMYCWQRRVVKFRNSICPPPPQLSLHTRAALSSNSNGTRNTYITERTQKAVYIVRCLWTQFTITRMVLRQERNFLLYQRTLTPNHTMSTTVQYINQAK
jgi:hypothetical protein